KAREALDEALSIGEKLAREHPKNIVFLAILARMYEARGKLHRESGERVAALQRYAMGLSTLDTLFQLEPRNKDGKRYLHEIREGRAIVLTQRGRYVEA